MNIRTAETPADLELVYPVIRELRPHLTFTDYTSLIAEAKARDEYEMVVMFDGDKCVAAMGFRILYDFVHGKHLYIDDLIVTESCRSHGVGAELLKYAERVALEKKCKGLRLCTGVDAKDSQRFYESNNWKARALAYKKLLPLFVVLFFLSLHPKCFAITNAERPEKGWWGFSIPKQYVEPPKSFDPNVQLLPLSTKGCERFFADKPKCTKYEEIDLVLNLIGTETWDEQIYTLFFTQAIYEHPWKSVKKFRRFPKNVKLATANKWSDVPEIIQRVLTSCHVVRNLIVGSHGDLGRLLLGNNGREYRVEVQEFFRNSGLLCVTTPESKIEFSACRMACNDEKFAINYASHIQQDLARLAESYVSSGGKSTLAGVQVLFNSGIGITDLPIWNALTHRSDTTGLSSRNDQAIVYTISESAVRADTFMANIKSCSK